MTTSNLKTTAELTAAAELATADRLAQQSVLAQTAGAPQGVGHPTEDGYLDFTKPSPAWSRANRQLAQLRKAESKAWSAAFAAKRAGR